MSNIAETISICPPVGPARERLVALRVHEWLAHGQLQKLVRHWGGNPPAGASVKALLDYLVPFSEAWDYRAMARRRSAANPSSQDSAGASRWEVTDDPLVHANRRLVLSAARALGLARVRLPRRRVFDYVLILGGARLSNLYRLRRAKELLERGIVDAGSIALLGSQRSVMPTERDATDTYAPDARTELDLLLKAAELELAGSSVTVHTLAAPSPEPGKRRATSADSYRFFHERLQPPPGASCLLVTSQIYVPYQHLEAVRMLALPHELELETIGFPVRWGGSLQGLRAPANYLQEIRSMIQASDRLVASLDPSETALAV